MGGAWQRSEYDAANRLLKVKTDDNVSVLASYTYGATNERLISDELGTRTYYASEGGQVLAEYVEYGGAIVPQWTKSYVYLGGRLLTTFVPVTGGEFVEHHHPDRLGTRVVTRPADGTSFEQASLPFGTALAAESTGGTNRRFTSYDRSGATGLDYAVNRRYDPMQGRFTQVDPIGMRATSFINPQTLNLYSYCGNDPINHTDPDGLFWGKIGRFFKKLGKIFSAVGAAVARILNNRWVRIGVFALDFFLPGFKLLSTALYKAISLGLKIYNKAADIASLLQLGGALLQGQFREFGTAVGLGIAGGLLSQVTSAIKKGVQDALFGGQFDELADLFVGAWKGFKAGLIKLGQTLEHAFDKFPRNLIPWYGNYCSPAATGSNAPGTGINSYDDSVCRPHDAAYQDKTGDRRDINQRRFLADIGFVARAIFGGAPNVSSFDIAFSGQFGGRPLIGSVHKFFSVPVFGVSAVVRKLRGAN